MSRNRKRKNPAPSYTSPIRSQKGCLCDDNTYHPDCCDGTLWGQGIGITEATIEEDFILQENSSFLLQENNYKIRQ
jgi:hypothetical protein